MSLRSHTVARGAHKQRLDRRRKLHSPTFMPVNSTIPSFEYCRKAEAYGYFDDVRRVLFEDRLTDALMDTLVRSGVLEDLTTQITTAIRISQNAKGLPLALQKGAAALAIAFLEERIADVASEVIARLAAIEHEKNPALKMEDLYPLLDNLKRSKEIPQTSDVVADYDPASYQILIDAHELRLSRRRKLDGISFKPVGSTEPFSKLCRIASALGYIDLAKLDVFTENLSNALLFTVVRVGVLEDISRQIAGTLLDNKKYKDSLVRQMKTGAAAVAIALIEESIALAASQVVLRLAAIKHEADLQLKMGKRVMLLSALRNPQEALRELRVDPEEHPSDETWASDPFRVVLQPGVPRNGRTGHNESKPKLPDRSVARLVREMNQIARQMAADDQAKEDAEALALESERLSKKI